MKKKSEQVGIKCFEETPDYTCLYIQQPGDTLTLNYVTCIKTQIRVSVDDLCLFSSTRHYIGSALSLSQKGQ